MQTDVEQKQRRRNDQDDEDRGKRQHERRNARAGQDYAERGHCDPARSEAANVAAGSIIPLRL
jgi:hypothetical protein